MTYDKDSIKPQGNHTTHGLSKTHPLYGVWGSMRSRCNNPQSSAYARYGGRGIKVCPRWDDFSLFVADMGERPSPSHSIERKDNDGDYCPDNCVWATPTEQGNNRRDNQRLTYQNKTQTVAQWAREIGIDAKTLYMRIELGWNAEDTLSVVPYSRHGFKGESHPMARLTETDVRQIRDEWQQGSLIKDLAHKWHMCTDQISKIVHFKSWSHLL